MKYSILAESYKKLDATTKRLEMIDILIQLFQSTPKNDFRKMLYLSSGKIGADYLDLELGFADRTVIKAIAKATGGSESSVTDIFRKKGDLGEVIEILKEETGQQGLGAFLKIEEKVEETLEIDEVWDTLHKIARTEGKGSATKKTNYLIGLLAKTSPLEAKYITRTVLSQLRLGVKDLTLIEALARTYGDGKDAREEIEYAYNVTSDIGEIGDVLVKQGIEGIRNIDVKVGVPIRMMAAQRMATAEEILEKLGGECALEFKYDGERVQAHICMDKISLFSRNLNEITKMFPDVVKALEESLTVKEAIIEGEITIEKIPVKVFMFDILYLNNKSVLKLSYPKRRKLLEDIITENEIIVPSSREIVTSVSDFERYFETAIESGCEGIMAKDIRKDTTYQAGNRGFLWIKHKFDYTTAFADSYDFVVVGGFYGKGRRKGTLGTLLMAALNSEEDRFETVCKLGSGFTDEDLAKITEELMGMKVDQKPKDVYSKLQADVWVPPIKVYEVQGADLSTSPVHTCAMDEIKEGTGIAIRFPRFIRYREDKGPDFATTTSEIISAYKRQRLMKE